jgi:hypothetical protein
MINIAITLKEGQTINETADVIGLNSERLRLGTYRAGAKPSLRPILYRTKFIAKIHIYFTNE